MLPVKLPEAVGKWMDAPRIPTEARRVILNNHIAQSTTLVTKHHYTVINAFVGFDLVICYFARTIQHKRLSGHVPLIFNCHYYH